MKYTEIEEFAPVEETVERNESEISVSKPADRASNEIHITVNGTSVTLKNKQSYKFVDVLDFYPFDLTAMHGRRLVTNVDGVHAEFIQPIQDGAVIDLYWEK